MDEIDGKVAALIAARKAGDYAGADALLAGLTGAGISVTFTPHGVKWSRRRAVSMVSISNMAAAAQGGTITLAPWTTYPM